MKNQTKLLSVIALFVIGALFTQSCAKFEDAVAFEVNQDLPPHHFDLDSASTSTKGESLLYSAYYRINIDSIFEANEIDKGKISEGKFKQIIIEIDNPTERMNFGFISSLSFRLGETENPDNAAIIAHAEGIGPNAIKITFQVNDGNMDKYLEQDKFFFFVFGTLEGDVPVEKLPLVIKSKIQFKVSPLK